MSSDDDQEEDKEENLGRPKDTKRGRPACPEKWTRVISIYKDDLTKVKTYELGPELLLDQSLSGTFNIWK